MIYSQWQPDTGTYAYFRTAERKGMGDDLPVPALRQSSPIGVASTDIGRSAGAGLAPAGSGKLARGSILPMSRKGLGFTYSPPFGFSFGFTDFVMLGVGVAAGWYAFKKWGKR